jgi:hypothetical protein
MPATTLITTPQFSRLIGLPGTPAIVDVRIDDDYRADPSLVPGSQRLRSSQASTSGRSCFRWRRLWPSSDSSSECSPPWPAAARRESFSILRE